MSETYTIDNLSGAPSLGYFESAVSRLISEPMIDHSFDHDELSISATFESAISSAEEAQLSTIVETAVEAGPQWKALSGSELFEFSQSGNRGWVILSRRVVFSREFPEVPKILLSNIVLDGLADVAVVKASKTFFDYAVRARNLRRASSELTRVTFDWEASR